MKKKYYFLFFVLFVTLSFCIKAESFSLWRKKDPYGKFIKLGEFDLPSLSKHNIVQLKDGRLFMVYYQPYKNKKERPYKLGKYIAKIYDYKTNTLKRTTDPLPYYMGDNLALLEDGRVLLVGWITAASESRYSSTINERMKNDSDFKEGFKYLKIAYKKSLYCQIYDPVSETYKVTEGKIPVRENVYNFKFKLVPYKNKVYLISNNYLFEYDSKTEEFKDIKNWKGKWEKNRIEDAILQDNGLITIFTAGKIFEFNPKNGHLKFICKLKVPRNYYYVKKISQELTLFASGKNNFKYVEDLEIYNNKTKETKIVGQLKKERGRYNVMPLPEKKILIFGGYKKSGDVIAPVKGYEILDLKNGISELYKSKFDPLRYSNSFSTKTGNVLLLNNQEIKLYVLNSNSL